MSMRILGDYNIIKQLGQGSLGSVFLAQHRFMKKQFVLKVLPEELASDRAFIQRFEEDIKNLCSLDHPGIVKIHNVSFAHGAYFLVTDCVVDQFGEAINLAQYVREKKRLSEEELLAIVRQIAEALDYAHKAGFAHRGIKMSNILMQGQGRFALSDFGLSKIVGMGYVLNKTYRILEGTMGHSAFVQNYLFLAPEQKVGLVAEPNADVYAFGVLVYHLITGEWPEGIFEMPSEKAPEFLLNWDVLVQACLQKNPEKRPTLLVEFMDSMLEKKEKEIEMILEEVPAMAVSHSAKEETMSVAERIQERIRSEYTVTTYRPEVKEAQSIIPIETEMKSISGGKYLRGCSNGSRDEMPRHAIDIDTFAIDIHPVTNEQFVRFLEALGSEKDANNHDVIRFRETRIRRVAGKLMIESGYAKHPVVGITWYGALAYAYWMGKRLPTEAEWEIAATGGLEEALYPTGDDIEKSQANFFSSDTTSVMSYAPNNFGLFDMAGNVYEWCHDWYDYHYYEHSAQEPSKPKGPVQGVYRVLRGGCWKSLKQDLRCAHRHRNNPGVIMRTYGFRCAKDLNSN